MFRIIKIRDPTQILLFYLNQIFGLVENKRKNRKFSSLKEK